jgi:hypothetical protein
MNDDDSDEGEVGPAEVDLAFAVQCEIGGPAPTHPSGYHPPRTSSVADESVPSILVRSSSTSSVGSPTAARAAHLQSPPWKESMVMLFNNPSYMYSTVGLTFVVFASGGLADWFPSWMNRVHNVDRDTAATLVGAITCVGGILGTAWGSWLGERAKGVIAQPYLGVAGLNLIVTTMCAWAVMVVPNIYLIGGLVFVAQISMWRSAETTEDTRPCHARVDVLIARARACFLLSVTPARSPP